MTVHLEAGPRSAGYRISALVERRMSHQALCTGGAIWGSQRPIAILIEGPDGLIALAPDGAPLDADELRKTYPEQLNGLSES